MNVTLEAAMAAQRALRSALDLPEETFPVASLIGMLSDEIEQLRTAGRDDTAIAALIAEASGAPVDADTVAAFYAPAEARRRGPR